MDKKCLHCGIGYDYHKAHDRPWSKQIINYLNFWWTVWELFDDKDRKRDLEKSKWQVRSRCTCYIANVCNQRPQNLNRQKDNETVFGNLTLTVPVKRIDALWHFETGKSQHSARGWGEVGSARHEPALLPPCPSIRVSSYTDCQRSTHSSRRAWQCLLCSVLLYWLQ